MKSLFLENGLNILPYPERRQTNRHQVGHILAVTSRGVGQILDLGHQGLSFGCLYPHNFPQRICIDLLDARGNHLKHLAIRIIWQRDRQEWDHETPFEVIYGAEFTDLTRHQQLTIAELLEGFEHLSFSLAATPPKL